MSGSGVLVAPCWLIFAVLFMETLFLPKNRLETSAEARDSFVCLAGPVRVWH